MLAGSYAVIPPYSRSPRPPNYVLLTSLSTGSSRSTHVAVRHHCFIPFHGWVVFHWADRPRSVCPLICWWTFALFPPLAIMDNAPINIHVQVSMSTYVFISLRYIPLSGIAGSYRNYLIVWRTVRWFLKVAVPFYISTSSVVWGIQSFHILVSSYLNFIPLDVKWYLVVLNFYFSDDEWSQTSFHVLSDHLYIFLVEVFIQNLGSF